MPISRSAKKSLRKANKNRKSNFSFKSKLKELIKGYLAKPTEKGLREVDSALDKSTKKFIYHKNKVARLKSRLAKKVAGVKVEKKTVKRTAKEKMSK